MSSQRGDNCYNGNDTELLSWRPAPISSRGRVHTSVLWDLYNLHKMVMSRKPPATVYYVKPKEIDRTTVLKIFRKVDFIIQQNHVRKA